MNMVKLLLFSFLLLLFNFTFFSQATSSIVPLPQPALSSFKINTTSQNVRSCSYTVRISTSCSSPRYTRDQISLSFGDAYGNQVYAPRLDDPSSRTFERCSADTFTVYGPCTYTICYVYLYRSGYDGWIPEYVQVYGYNTKAVTFYYNTRIPSNTCIAHSILNVGHHPKGYSPNPNTDGIDIYGSRNVTVKNSYIGTEGDDCIAVSGGSFFVNINGISCGPGHGISIGALGKGQDKVEEIHVQNRTLRGTLTEVRIKSWQTSVVELSDILYKSVSGTSRTDQVINLSCRRSLGCINIRIEQVYIKSTTPHKRVYAINAHGTWSHTIPSVRCLLR